MEQAHMHTGNRSTFNGGQLEAINLYILKTEQVISVCHMMENLFSVINEPIPHPEKIQQFRDSPTTRYGTGALFGMIADYLHESLDYTEEIIAEGTTFADPAVQKLYHYPADEPKNHQGGAA